MNVYDFKEKTEYSLENAENEVARLETERAAAREEASRREALAARAEEERRRQEESRLLAEMQNEYDEFAVEVKSNGLTALDVPIRLSHDEHAYDHDADGIGLHEDAGGGALRQIDEGELCITNMRLLFIGRSTNRSVDITKVMRAVREQFCLRVSTSQQQATMVFSGLRNPLIAEALCSVPAV